MIKTLFITISCLLLSTLYYPSNAINQVCKDRELLGNDYQIRTVVLDAGHGGKDDGCSGKHSKEKHLTLDITLALGKAIEAYYPAIEVIYTRTKDVFIPLHERAAIANASEADLFISIHCNALGAKLAYIRGTETFVMGLEESEHNTEVARRENESILLEEDYKKNYEGFDPNSDEGHIFLSMFQNAFLDRSILLAEKIEKHVSTQTQRKSRGVRQAAFVVLKETTMPSVLIETGFLTNAKDELFLSSKNGQAQMADAVFNAFKEYKTEVEQEGWAMEFSLDESTASAIPTEQVEEVQREASVTPSAEAVTIEVEAPSLPEDEFITQPAHIIIEDPISSVQKEILVSEASYRATKPAPTEVLTSNEPIIPSEELLVEDGLEVSPSIAEEDIIVVPASTYSFSVQVAASTTPLDMTGPQWKQVEDLAVQNEKRLYKYLAGNYLGYDQAAARRIALTQLGFKGAFVVAYKDGQRVSLKVARAAMEMP